MIALGASQALEGVATNATEVNYTIGGLLMSNASPPVANTYEVLAQGQLPSSAGSLYNPGGSATALISYISLFNTDAIAQTVSLFLTGAAAANTVATFNIPAGGWAEYDGNGWTVYNSSGVAGALPTVSSYITSNVTLTATTAINITSLTLPPGTWLIVGSVVSHLTTATLGHVDFWLGPNSASATGAYVAATASMGDVAGGTEESDATLVAVVTFTSSTTVYLEGYASEASTAEHLSTEQSIPNVTGILAIQL